MKKISLICFLFFVLMSLGPRLTSQNHGDLSDNYNKSLSALQKIHKTRVNKIHKNDQKLYKLQAAIVAGDTSLLYPALKKPYKNLGLIHLFTPSGFHLAAFLFLFQFKKIKRFKNAFLYSLLSIFFVNGFEALKRILVIKILEAQKKRLPKFLQNSFSLFLFVFLIFFILGDFSANYLSFSFSFLFLGMIYSLKEHEEYHEFYYFFAFFFAQLLIQFYLPQNVGLQSFFKGFIIGFLFNLLFPLMCLSHLLMYLFPSDFLLIPIKLCHFSVVKANLYYFEPINFIGFIFWLFLIFSFLSLFNKRYKKIILSFCAFFLASTVNYKLKKPSEKLLKEVKTSLYLNDKI